jgi:NADPH:quinone reductase-like Zn-dependent oxidoreductase
MGTDNHESGLQLRSLVTEDGTLELSLARVPAPEPGPDDVLIRVEAAPINPSDLGLLVGGADVSGARSSGAGEDTKTTMSVPPAHMRAMAARVGQSLPAGNEGAGVVIKAGANARELLGKTVALFGGAMYSQHRVARASDLLVLPEDATAVEGAACFVNPLTALAMVGAMRLEGHAALVHTAAASNLGQMLVKICLEDGVPLVNVVRSAAQVDLLRGIGAVHVVDSSAPDFQETLTQAMIETGATVAFDAIGGGRLGGQILAAMEAAAVRQGVNMGRYGSSVFKQLYIYGGLDPGPTEIHRSFGFAFAISGFLLMPFLERVGREEAERYRQRVAANLRTTFASRYTREISLFEMLRPDILAGCNKKATGEKYLVRPQTP